MSDEMDEIWELYADDGAQALDATETALEAVMAGAGDPAAHVAACFARCIPSRAIPAFWACPLWKAARIWPRI
jgi:hypothetical protein